MKIAPKWDKRNNQWKNDMSFYKVLDTINRMINNKAENSPTGTTSKPTEP